MQSFWLRLVAFGTYALALAEPFEGDMLAVSGDLRYSVFTGRDGKVRQNGECLVDGIHSQRVASRRGEKTFSDNGPAVKLEETFMENPHEYQASKELSERIHGMMEERMKARRREPFGDEEWSGEANEDR